MCFTVLLLILFLFCGFLFYCKRLFLLISFFVCSLLLYRNIIDFCILILYLMGFPGTQVVKNSLANARDVGSIPGSGRSLGGGNDISLQYSCLGNPMDRGAQWATVHGVTKSWTQLSMQTHPRLYLTASLNFFISAKSLFSRLGGVSYIQKMSSANTNIFSSSFPIWMPHMSFSFLISMGRNFNTVQNKSVESGHPCLIPNLWRSFQSLNTNNNVSCGFYG